MDQYSVWWEPPELFGGDFPRGMWVVAEQHDPANPPIYGDCLAGGPIDVSAHWLAEQLGSPAVALTREEDFEIGLHSQRPDGGLDYDHVERWITCRRYTATAARRELPRENAR